MLPLDPTALILLAGLLGLLVGSFISMLTWRLPRIMHLEGDEQLKQISLSRSECPNCQTSLPWYRLFPLISWIASKGKCHACDHKISARYPLIEFTSMAMTAGMVYIFGNTLDAYLAILFSWFLLTITVIDIEHQLILDKLSLPLMWLGLMINSQSYYTSPVDAIWGAVLGYMILWFLFQSFKLFTGKEGMGYGDFKFLAALGAWFGAMALPQIILIASISSVVIGLTLALLRLRSMDQPIPFGPYLALGGWITLLLGNNLIQQL